MFIDCGEYTRSLVRLTLYHVSVCTSSLSLLSRPFRSSPVLYQLITDSRLSLCQSLLFVMRLLLLFLFGVALVSLCLPVRAPCRVFQAFGFLVCTLLCFCFSRFSAFCCLILGFITLGLGFVFSYLPVCVSAFGSPLFQPEQENHILNCTTSLFV